MNAEQRKATVRNVFEGVAHGNADPLLNMLADDVRWTIIGSTRFSGTFTGKQDVVERLLSPLGEKLDGHLHITVDNMLADGDYVVAQGRGASKTRAGGTYDNTYCWVYRWSGDKVVEITEYLDTEVVTASFGR